VEKNRKAFLRSEREIDGKNLIKGKLENL